MKLIPNSKDYYVCEKGFVHRNGRQLTSNRDTYLTVRISYKDKTTKDYFVHRLVAMLYLPNPENKPIVNHKDGNKHNNALYNLEWVTSKENAVHAVEIGLRKKGAEAPNAKITADQVHEICKMLSEGYRVKDIKDKFGICGSSVSMIKAKKQFVDIASQYVFPEKKKMLSPETVKWIWHSLKAGKTAKQIIADYHGNLSRALIYNIKTGKAYSEITDTLK